MEKGLEFSESLFQMKSLVPTTGTSFFILINEIDIAVLLLYSEFQKNGSNFDFF